MDAKPFADLRKLLDEKNHRPAKRHGTAKAPEVMNLKDARAKMTEMMRVSQQDQCTHDDMDCPPGTCDWSGRDGRDG